jgi:hypothetical protein
METTVLALLCPGWSGRQEWTKTLRVPDMGSGLLVRVADDISSLPWGGSRLVRVAVPDPGHRTFSTSAATLSVRLVRMPGRMPPTVSEAACFLTCPGSSEAEGS